MGPQINHLCVLIQFIRLSVSIDLNALYTDNLTLQSSETYHVVNDVLLQQSLIVPSNVTIVFQGNYKLTIQGSVNIGCNDVNTFSTHSVGIAEDAQSVHIYNHDNTTRQGTIYAEQSASVCNTRFSNMYYSLDHRGNTYQYIIDNNIFENQGRLWLENSDASQITDNIFINSEYGVLRIRNSLITNNLFQNIERTVLEYRYRVDNNITNNTFINQEQGTQPTGIWYWETQGTIPNISFNTFTNFYNAIYIHEGEAHINHNTFINNDVAIYIKAADPLSVSHIHFNNFINNTASIEAGAGSNIDQPFVGYNYYGTSSLDQLVVGQQIWDICGGGYSFAKITWWPWYTEPIDFNALPTYPTETNISSWQCIGRDNHPEISGNKLGPLYWNDLTLNASESPYYVVRNVWTELNIDVVIEGGVEIVFADDYEMHFKGNLNIGCISFNTTNIHSIGIADASHSVSIYNQDNTTRQGSIYVEQSTLVCNTKFSNLYHSLYHEGINTNQFVLDNNLFNNQNRIWLDVSAGSNAWQITDNIFRNSVYGLLRMRNSLINNNIFENIEQTAIELRNSVDNIISDNIFVNQDTNAFGIWYWATDGTTNNITLNTFTNFNYGIYIYRGETYITYNTFIGNQIAIQIKDTDNHIHYNNFIDNIISIQSQVNTDQTHCNYNWNGYVADISDPYLVSLNIDDVCDSNGYSAVVTFWPYFDSLLLFDDIDNLPALYTFDFTNCDSFVDQNATLVSDQPTRSPTSLAPTMNPTFDPTLTPTNSPTNRTTIPTSHPTKIPTNPSGSPTIDPTMDPTYQPTVDPTVDPTTNPTYTPTTEPTEDPTFDPTKYPTFDPTYDPTADPTIEPTHNPTLDPSMDPTMDPTKDPTIDPTKDPTVVPTADPTIEPTDDPTNDPTSYPTDDPTTDPTFDPTDDPTSDPTDDPTQDPIVNPTIHPTQQPTYDPSSSPSSSPSTAPTMSPLTFAELLIENVNDIFSTKDDILLYVGIGSVGIFILFLAFVTKKNDDQDYDAVALYILQCFDLYSDILLAVLLYKYYIYSKLSDNIETQETEFLAALCWICALSTLIPYFLNIMTSINIIMKVNREKNIPSFTKDYFDSHTRIYALGVLLNGGCYTTLALLNSKLFNLAIFNSGLSLYKLREFEHFKIINTVFLENISQVIVQGLILDRFGSKLFGITIWASFVTSFLSILLTVMVWCLHRTGNHDYFRISLLISVIDVRDNNKHKINEKEFESETQKSVSEYDASKYLLRMIRNSRYRKKLGKQIADFFGIAVSNIQILSAFRYQSKLRVNGIFRCNKHESLDPETLVNTTQSMRFIDLIQSTYDIHDSLLNIQIKVYKVNDEEINDDTNKNDDAKALLNEWNLGQYWNVLQQNGYGEVDDWMFLVETPQKLRDYGFKDGHIHQFQKKCKEKFESVETACVIELEDVKEGGEGRAVPDAEGRALPDAIQTQDGTNKTVDAGMAKIKSYSEDPIQDADASQTEDEVDELVNIALEYHDNL